MTNPQLKTVKVHRSGNSNVVSLPRMLNVEIGDEFTVTGDTNKIILERKLTDETKKNLAALKKFVGKFPGSSMNMTPKEIDDFIEGVYD